ncbi:endonuclease/exonuclease/phosphatase family protein [Neolewinella persica]|uniref:endonuclease/exonuclease/phosphatase family protein n=1 Tax=Neolewinella persica TaxID=70998 RepID=UPI0003A6419D|nr:endonuclease/exonuclease/phosphatase family protein [Neolewinella persica]
MLRLSFASFLFLLVITATAQELRLVSWNVQDMGRTITDADIDRMAALLRDADVVAIQEVVAKDPAGAQRVAALDAALDRTGTEWDYRISPPTSSTSSYDKERYAFLWRRSKVKMLRYQLDNTVADAVVREPFWLEVAVKGFPEPIWLVNFHSLPHAKGPEQEIPYLIDYPDRVSGQPLIYLGDWNMKPDHKAFRPLFDKGYAIAAKNLPTTLKRKCTATGNYLNYPIDNIFYPTAFFDKEAVWVIDFVENCSTLETDRKLSDHLPICLTLTPHGAPANR